VQPFAHWTSDTRRADKLPEALCLNVIPAFEQNAKHISHILIPKGNQFRYQDRFQWQDWQTKIKICGLMTFRVVVSQWIGDA
jgi:hypothetical protein